MDEDREGEGGPRLAVQASSGSSSSSAAADKSSGVFWDTSYDGSDNKLSQADRDAVETSSTKKDEDSFSLADKYGSLMGQKTDEEMRTEERKRRLAEGETLEEIEASEKAAEDKAAKERFDSGKKEKKRPPKRGEKEEDTPAGTFDSPDFKRDRQDKV